MHPDTTTFSLYGKYNTDDDSDSEEVIKITKGYSKDNNPDLNQVVLSLMCSYRSSIPVWLEVLSGNSNDKKSFRRSISAYKKQFTKKKLPYVVADSALYTEESLTELSGTKWVTRVPETIKDAKEAIMSTVKTDMVGADEPGYWIKEISNNYANVVHLIQVTIGSNEVAQQKWLIVYSQTAYEKQYATLTKNIRKECEKKDKEFWHLSKNAFACEADAVKAAQVFSKKMKYHTLGYSVIKKNRYEKKGRPDQSMKPINQEYFLSGSIKIDSQAIGEASRRKGFFIIATNELSAENISNEQLLSVYKAQGVSVERGFRFLKDPLFYADSLYLKSPKRIMALLMVMGISLLVYSLAEKKLRKALAKYKHTIPDQKRKPTSTPTIRWTFHLFEGIILLYIRDGTTVKNVVTNLKEEHHTVINALGDDVKKMYFFEN